MPEQTAIATSQRRNLLLEAIRRLSKARSWVTQRDLLADLRGQGFDVQKHHILRDLKALVQIHPELECHDGADHDARPRRGVEYGYRWVARDAAPETGLSIPEALSLVLVSRHLKHALPATLAGSLEKLFRRAETTLDLQAKNGTARWQDLVGVVTPAQPMLPAKVSDEVMQVVHQALIAREQFRGVYRNSRGEQEERIVNPLGIMVREPTIYLIGVVAGRDEPRQFALHRFLSAERLHVPAWQPEDFSLHAYLEEQGNFGAGKWIALKGRVSANLGLILEETPLASNQVLGAPDADGWRDLSAKVRDNWQLRWWVLAQGERMVVQAPAELRERMVQTAGRLQALYRSS